MNQEIAQHPLNMSALNNSEKIEFETKLIKEVFQLDLKILFKEYTKQDNGLKNNYFKN